MNKHPEKLISSYIDNELTGTARTELEEHLKSCSKCRELAEDLSSLKERINNFYSIFEAPETIEQRIMSAMMSTKSRFATAGLFSFVLLCLLFLVPLGTVIIKPLSAAFKILLHLFTVGQVVITADPNTTGRLILSAAVLMLATAWSLKYLLAMEEVN